MYIVTGGGSGIGRELAHALASRGKDVLIIGRRKQALIETASSPHITYLVADVSTSSGRQCIYEYLKNTPTLEGLIHNAGVVEPMVAVTAIDEIDWRQVMATNLEAPLFITQLLREKLTGGRVLNMGSGAAYFPIAGWVAYCVSKAGLSMLTRCWQLECKDMAVASVMPGIIDTDMQAKIRHASHMEADKQNFFKQLYETHRLLKPATVALFLCWLLLDIDQEAYVSKEWDIYDKTHHHAWLIPPHTVPGI